MRIRIIAIAAIGLSLAAALCSATGAVAAQSGGKSTPVKGLAGIRGLTKSQIKQWSNLVAAAQHEGHLVVLSGQNVAFTTPFFNYFGSEFGINVTVIGGSPASLTARVLAERQQGLHPEDISDLGDGTTGNLLKAGVYQPLLPNIILKTDLNRSTGWYSTKFPWCDIDPTKQYCVNATLTPGVNAVRIYYNTQLVTPQDIAKIKSWNDFLNPKWAGKVEMQDVAVGIDSADEVTGWYLLGEKYWTKFMQVLRPTVLSSSTSDVDAINGLLRGQWAFDFFSASVTPYTTAISQGVPIAYFPKILKPGAVAAFGQHTAMMANAPDQAAAKLFMNWFLAPEGQAAFNEYNYQLGDVALRTTVPRGNIPEMLWQEARKTRSIFNAADHPLVTPEAAGWWEQEMKKLGDSLALGFAYPRRFTSASCMLSSAERSK